MEQGLSERPSSVLIRIANGTGFIREALVSSHPLGLVEQGLSDWPSSVLIHIANGIGFIREARLIVFISRSNDFVWSVALQERKRLCYRGQTVSN